MCSYRDNVLRHTGCFVATRSQSATSTSSEKPGGKSTMLFNRDERYLCRRRCRRDRSARDLAQEIIDAIPSSRINGCVPRRTDTERPVGFNPATRISPERKALAAAGIVSAFKHLWSDSWGPRLSIFFIMVLRCSFQSHRDADQLTPCVTPTTAIARTFLR